APGANWTAIFKPRERVRLRFINGSSMTIFDVRIPNLPMTVVQTDGNDVEPVTVDEFRISVAETYDVIVEPPDSSAYTIFAQSMDRTGYARATLAPRIGMSAAVPPMDPRPLLTMVDMGMGDMAGGHEMHGMHPGAVPEASQGGASAPAMGGMHQSHSTGAAMAGGEHSGAAAAAGAVAYAMPFPQPGPHTSPPPVPIVETKAALPNPIALHTGPQVDNVAMMPTDRLAEPGLGLNNNGRRVLTYADLRSRYRGV